MNRLFCAAAALVMTSTATLPALAASCVSPQEARALQVRQLHIQLQVASLNCRTDDPSLPGKYAAYVNRFGGALTDNAKILRGHFAKTGVNMDRYVTTLANDESQRAHQVEGYCESHVPLFEKLSGTKPSDLEHLAVATLGMPDRQVCSTGPVIKQASAEVKPKAAANTVKKEKAEKPAKAEPKS